MFKLNHKNIVEIGLYGLAIAIFILSLPKENISSDSYIPEAESKISPQQVKTEISYQKMVNWHLFGISETTAVKTFSQANIKLMGVIYKGEGNEQSQAILSINNREQFYKVGQEIQGVGKINTVEENRVLISTKDGLEALELFKK
jgi:hypothetical protein